MRFDIEGRSQAIAVDTNPPGAECGLYREQGARLATIAGTPGKALIEKTKNDMWIVCVKSGYQQATYYDRSGVAGAAFANIIGGVFTLGIATVVGAAIDSSNGSDNMYQSPVTITMVANGSDGAQASLPATYEAPKPAATGQQQQQQQQQRCGASGRARDGRPRAIKLRGELAERDRGAGAIALVAAGLPSACAVRRGAIGNVVLAHGGVKVRETESCAHNSVDLRSYEQP